MPASTQSEGAPARSVDSTTGLLLLTAVGAVLLLGEQLTLRLGLCAVLVIAGTWLGRPVPART